jgi:hypothetical protein
MVELIWRESCSKKRKAKWSDKNEPGNAGEAKESKKTRTTAHCKK